MSDLVKRYWEYKKRELASRIEELERELAIAEKMATDANDAYSQAHEAMCDALDQLSAEKALADRLYDSVTSATWDHPAYEAYRKARGL